MGKSLMFIGILVPALALFGCSGGGSTAHEVAASYEGPIASKDKATGADVYESFCEGCHPGGAKGKGPAIADLAWSPGAMRQQVREGERKMPAFGEDKISTRELEALLAYLKTIRGVN